MSEAKLFDGKKGLVLGIANDRSIAWAITEKLFDEGAEIGFTHLPGDRSRRRVEQLVEPRGAKMLEACNVQEDGDLDRVFEKAKDTFGTLDFVVHSIAFAGREALTNPYHKIQREHWSQAMEISAYSLVAVAGRAAELMTDGGSILTITYLGGERVFPSYNVMGVCKAALEHSVRYVAGELGEKGIRVNSISAGPMRTLASAGVPNIVDMLNHHAEKSPLKRNVTQEDIGRTAAYLLGDMSSGLTGETIHLDCGYHIMGL